MPEVYVTELDGLADAHRVATLVEVLIDGRVERELEVIDGQASYDSRAAIRGQLSLTVPTPEGSDLVPTGPDSLLAPYGAEIRAARGRTDGDDERLVELGTFRIDRATADGDTVKIAALDRAAIVIDAAFEEPYNVLSGAGLIETIQDVVAGGYPAVEWGEVVDIDVPLPALYAEEGEDRWAFAQGLGKSAGLLVHFGDDGKAAIRAPAGISAGAVATFTEGSGVELLTHNDAPSANLLSVARDMDRGPVYNKVTVTGENTSETTVARGVAVDNSPTSPTRYDGPFGRKPMPVWSNPYITSDEQAETAAVALLAEKVGAPDVISIEALVDPARRPWDVVRITREKLGLDQDHVLDQVSIPLAYESSMNAATRATQELSL